VIAFSFLQSHLFVLPFAEPGVRSFGLFVWFVRLVCLFVWFVCSSLVSTSICDSAYKRASRIQEERVGRLNYSILFYSILFHSGLLVRDDVFFQFCHLLAGSLYRSCLFFFHFSSMVVRFCFPGHFFISYTLPRLGSSSKNAMPWCLLPACKNVIFVCACGLYIYSQQTLLQHEGMNPSKSRSRRKLSLVSSISIDVVILLEYSCLHIVCHAAGVFFLLMPRNAESCGLLTVGSQGWPAGHGLGFRFI
jgi:hypothetical protein